MSIVNLMKGKTHQFRNRVDFEYVEKNMIVRHNSVQISSLPVNEIATGKLFPDDVDQIVHFGLLKGPQDGYVFVYFARFGDEMGNDEVT